MKGTEESSRELRRQAQQAESKEPVAPVVHRPVRRYRARLFQLALGATSAGFAVLFAYALRMPYFAFDLPIARWLQSWHRPWLDVTMIAVSNLGFNPSATILTVATILLVFLIGLKWESVMLMFASIGVGVLNSVVKAIVQRGRPTEKLIRVLNPVSGYSFPSGHVVLFTVFWGFLLFLVYTLMPRSWLRGIGLGLLSAVIVLMGASRIYLGDHWPSDVIGGYLLGSLWLTLTVYLYRKGKKRFFVRQPVAPA